MDPGSRGEPPLLSELCRHTGLPCARLVHDQLAIPHSIKDANRIFSERLKSGVEQNLPKTQTTRRGDLMLFTRSLIKPEVDRQVTAKELLYLTDAWMHHKMNYWRKRELQKTDAGTAAYIGMLKQNMEFPDHWMAEARDLVPPGAILQGLSFSRYIRGEGHKTKKEICMEYAESRERLRYPTWMSPCGMPSYRPPSEPLNLPKPCPRRTLQRTSANSAKVVGKPKPRKPRVIWYNRNSSNLNTSKNGTSGRPGSPVDFDSDFCETDDVTQHLPPISQNNITAYTEDDENITSVVKREGTVEIGDRFHILADRARDSPSHNEGTFHQETDVLSQTTDLESPQSLLSFSRLQLNGNAASELVNSDSKSSQTGRHKKNKRPKPRRRRKGRRSHRGRSNSETTSTSNAEAVQVAGSLSNSSMTTTGGKTRSQLKYKLLEKQLKSIHDLHGEAKIALQRADERLIKLREERDSEFRRKQVRKYNIRWQLRMRQLENCHSFRHLEAYQPRSAALGNAEHRFASLQPTANSWKATEVGSKLRSARSAYSLSPSSPSHCGVQSGIEGGAGHMRLREQRASKTRHRRGEEIRVQRMNAEGLLTVKAWQLASWKKESMIEWEREECERLNNVTAFRASVEETAKNQTLKPMQDILSVLDERANDVAREMRFLHINQHSLHPYGDSVPSIGLHIDGNPSSSLEHLQFLMAASRSGMRRLSRMPRFYTLQHRGNRSHEIGSNADMERPRITNSASSGQSDVSVTSSSRRRPRSQHRCRPLHQRSLSELKTEVKRLESHAIERFFECLERRKALLGGEEARLPAEMIRSAGWRQEMLGLELWSSRLSTSGSFSYFEFVPMVGEFRGNVLVRGEKRFDAEEEKWMEAESTSGSESDYCN